MATATQVKLPYTRSEETGTLGVMDVPVVRQRLSFQVITPEGESIRSESPISIDDLYPVQEALAPDLGTALSLLREAIGLIERALEAIRSEDVIEADSIVLRLQVLLPELFCCRTLGDGFGAVINAAMWGLHNRRGKPLDKRQIETLHRVLSVLRSKPFLHFEAALDLVSSIEEVGLRIDVEGIEVLSDWLDE